jgi:hypothetical protein
VGFWRVITPEDDMICVSPPSLVAYVSLDLAYLKITMWPDKIVRQFQAGFHGPYNKLLILLAYSCEVIFRVFKLWRAKFLLSR